MPIEEGWLLRAVERERRYCEGRSAVYADALRAIVEDLSHGRSAWFHRLAEAWSGRTFGPYYEPSLLLLAGIHREALAGRASELARQYPDCGGSPSNPGSAVLSFLRNASPDFFAGLRDARLQTNEPARSSGWMLAACAGFMSRGLPFHLVDLGTSAGLTLIGDYLPRETALLLSDGSAAADPERWRESPYPVLSRTGFDARPLRLAEPEDRLWLRACLWPDDAERARRLEKGIELFLKLEKERAGPKLLQATFAEMPERVASGWKPHAEEGLLVYTSQAGDFLDERSHAALSEGLAAALKPWGDRAYWVELEFPRGLSSEPPGEGPELHELRVHRWIEGRWQSRTLATATAHPRELRLLPGWDFLAPLAPVAPPRVTIEERPKSLQPGVYRFPGGSDA